MNATAEKRYAIYGIKKGEKTHISDDGDLHQAKCWAREIVGGLGRRVKGVRYIQTEVWDRQANDGAGKPVFRVWVGPLGSVYTTDSVGVKADPEEPETVEIKTTGTYADRAEALAKAFEKTLNKVLGANYLYEKRGESPKHPGFNWDLKDKVSIHITRSGGADPKIWVYRDDPIHEPPNNSDWKHEYFERDYEDKLYHVGRIAVYVKEQMEYNRKKLAEHNANVEKFNTDMQGTLIPTGVSVERNPKTGFYELHMTATIKELSGEEVKFVVAKCKDFKQAVEPFERKEGGSDA
jgi:hypothetical protein